MNRTFFLPILSVASSLLLLSGCQKEAANEDGFPFVLPAEKPERQLSEALHRNYDNFEAARPEDNEFYSLFKYTELEGFDYNNFDGTITRRDPSKVIFHNGKYYVYYTHRDTGHVVRGPARATDVIPARDWDLSEIWYATSEDGFKWEEQGVAIPRAEKPNPGWRSVSTADILEWEGKYYMYYQAFSIQPVAEGDYCPVAVSVADSPDGPWTPINQVVIPNGAEDEWDGYSIHDPYPLVFNGKIYLYYKSDFDVKERRVRMQGLAIADNPLGPFEKHPLNPVLNSGHETTLFPFREGIAALQIRDGNEHYTVQYSEDGVNFEVKAITELMPFAAGPFIPDAFTDTDYGRGITWGISHNIKAGNINGGGRATVLMRFDCDLSLDHHDPLMKKHNTYLKPEVYYSQVGLTKAQREAAAESAKAYKK
ncbi:glycoside hydrolase family 117 protein [Pelagicoccus mobilis]|uniref:Family 43 glycosylhydrolase n=1 Tax=Pelagicoccus mobilis TaxID=415221 RepID=A0A934RUQ9_9BACT|nr:family 43 glycosylhydrolase [Pelagicoccus mobilis]MBK1875790.1 family 43 glycosylhydrolase [Pelagicoccus mobilis]